MTYNSPFKLLPALNLEGKQVDYKLLRRKLLAEFELNDDQPLELNDNSIGKTEALRIIDELKDEDILNQHLEIFNNQGLLSFLEGVSTDYILDPNNHSKNIPEVGQEAFVVVLNKEIVKSYRASDYRLLEKIMSFPISEWIIEKSDNPIYERFYKAVKSDLIELREILDLDIIPEKTEQLNQCQEIYTEDRAKCVNLLPDDFSNLIDDLAQVSINLSVRIYKGEGDKRAPLKLCLFVLALDTSEEYLALARKNHKTINKYGVLVGPVNLKKYALTIVVILLVLFAGEFFFKLFTSGKSEDSNKQELVEDGPWEDILTFVNNTISKPDTLGDLEASAVNGQMARTTYYNQYFLGRQIVVFENLSDQDVVLGAFVDPKKKPVLDTDEMSHSWYLIKGNTSLTIDVDTLFGGLIAVIGGKWLSSEEGFLANYSKNEGCHYLIEPEKDGYFSGKTAIYFLQNSNYEKKDSKLTYTLAKPE